MKTTISKNFHVAEPMDKVWDYLANPEKIASCVPGAEITEKIDDRNFKGEVTMKFGPVKAKYNGEITIEELNVEEKIMKMKGEGKDSKGKGSAEMLMTGILSEAEDGGTNVEYNMDVSISGMLAQFGSRLITDVSDQIAGQFIDNFKAKLAGEEIQENTISAGSLAGKVLKNKIGGLFGGSKEA